MSKRMKTVLSLLLAVCLLVSAMPAYGAVASAEEDGSMTTSVKENVLTEEEISTDVMEIESEESPYIVREDPSLRGAYEKHYLMSDGSYQAAVYNEPVHRLEDGAWVEIDNTLTLRSAADGTARYANADGLMDVSFAKRFGDRLVTVEQDGYSLSWSVQAVPDSTNSLTATAQPLTGSAQAELTATDLSAYSAQQQMTMATKSSSAITYRDALAQDVDLEYIVLPSRVKENIILQSPKDISAYVVTVYTEGLAARLLENRQVQFYDGEDVIFTMAAPYMYDSGAELSEDIAVELVPKGSGCWLIRMVPDEAWLEDEARVYPVVIDPEVSTSTTQQNIIDTYVLEGSGVQNNNLDRLYIGNKSGSRARSYVRFAVMPTIPASSTITEATMTLQLLDGTSTANNISAYQVLESWDPTTVTWSTRPSASTRIGLNFGHNYLSHYDISCLATVQSWYSGSTTGQNANYGIMLRYTDETIADYNSVYSADCSTASKRPSITFTYQPPSSSVDIDEGSTKTLTPPDVTGTITWTSSDTSVARVSSSGKVTAVKAGKATINASVSGTVHKTYTVYVTIADGVYRIKNKHLGYYLGTYGRISEPTNTSLLTEQDSGFEELCQLWKITYMSGGYYSIRPMHKLDMALHVGGSPTVNYRPASTTDAVYALDTSFWWTISHGSSGYILNYYGSSGLNLQPAEGAASPGLGVIVAAYSSSKVQCHWDLQKLTSPPSGVLLYDTSTGKTIGFSSRYLVAGTTKTLEALDLAACAYSGNASATESITWSCTSGSSYITINSSTGTITANSPGTSLITGTSRYGTIKLYITVTGSSSTDFTFINHYDASFMANNSELVGFIDDAVNFVNTAYQRQFSVSFSSSTDPYYRAEAITDACPLGTNASCHDDDECGTSCNGSHHKNLVQISNHLYSSTIPQNHIVVFWTNRTPYAYCRNDKRIMSDGATVYACVYQNRPVIHILFADYDSNRLPSLAINLAHELVHALGMDDEYGDSLHSETNWNCVMEPYSSDTEGLLKFYDDVFHGRKNLFCSSCEAKIKELLADST